MLALLGHDRPRWLGGALVGLRLRGRRSGRQVVLPVMYAADGSAVWVAVARSRSKSWWRNVSGPTSVELLRGGSWRRGTAGLVTVCDDRSASGRAAYAQRWPRAVLGRADPMVRITSTSDVALGPD
ncbi:MAG: nitroreductase family deazaflavin-dependent oxidoreductase [Nocardioides sp.]|nr:nitroreductase family deazaflavin-dependent oxidoreductase [Nocardioides sp.]